MDDASAASPPDSSNPEPTAGTDSETADVVAPPPLLLSAALLAAAGAQRARPLPLPGGGATRLAGGAVLAAAVAGFAWARATLSEARTPINPYQPTASIVERGPYGRSRNPVYVAFLAAAVGAGLATRSAWPLLLAPALTVALDRGVIRREERYLERRFGERYRRYRERVPRWL